MLCLHYEDVSQTAPAAVNPICKTLTGQMAGGEKAVQKKEEKKKIVNPLTPVTLGRVGQMLSAHDSQLNI